MSPLPPTRDRPVLTAGDAGRAGAAGYSSAQVGIGRRRWLRRIGIVLIVCLAVLLGAVVAVTVLAKREIDELVTPKTAALRAAQTQLKAPLPGRPANILLLGSDHRKSVTGEDDQRSDTLLLVRLDPKRESISMLSLPRDLYVNIPGHGQAKINDAYTLGGPKLAVQTVKEATGLDINFVMNVDFTGFRGVVDQLGGVWVDVDRTYLDNVSNQVSDIDIKPGYQLLNGEDALAFSRFRHDVRGDFNRIARQQLVLDSLKKQLSASFGAKQVPGLFRLFKTNADVAQGGGNSVDARVLYNYLRLGLQLKSRDVYQIEYEGDVGEAGEASIVVFNEDKMRSSVDAFLAPSASAREKTADQLVGKAPPSAEPAGADPAATPAPAATPDPSTVTVRVLNGSGTAGVAGSMSEQLTQAGYQVDPNPSNADASTYPATRVQYRLPANKAAAEALAATIPGATAAPADNRNAFSTQLLVIVGKTGQTVEGAGAGSGPVGGPTGGPAYSGNTVPEKGTADVTTDPSRAKDYFLETRSMRLPILYPTTFESSSEFEEVRQYQIAHRDGNRSVVEDAYRLVAETSGGDYWGLQGTSWANPPILEDPTREARRGGRTYKLYFNGTKLHMVAWSQGTGTYWISNSPLNNLSNETMLAIADGVKPLE